MKNITQILTYGFAIFAMFFGSGNLVFPISIGYNSGASWIFGFLGLFLTGIILPFLGLFVIKLYNGSYKKFFNDAGRIAGFFVPLVTISLLGSFGVVPRCITVAHGGINYINNDIPLWLFAFLFSVASYIFCLKENFMIKIIGKYMSPVLLIFLLYLVFAGIFSEGSYTITNTDAASALSEGFFTGYHTMDLFAAFFFSSLIFNQISKDNPNMLEKDIIIMAAKASVIGSVLIALVYLGFVYLGAHFSHILSSDKPQQNLPKIAGFLFGQSSSWFLSISIILSCITTAVALNNIYAKYLIDLLKLNKQFYPLLLVLTTSMSFAVSLLDFSVISGFLGPILSVLYPALIGLTIFCIFTRGYKKYKFISFWILIILNAFF
jgi:branched-chain amino acid:cation transporter, LIVCS family